ncbi:MAG: hypothetical protein HW412_964 [Bacteroidetes bacterium]|nr:hypothetical protein [Bacteroidota bacterium]
MVEIDSNIVFTGKPVPLSLDSVGMSLQQQMIVRMLYTFGGSMPH